MSSKAKILLSVASLSTAGVTTCAWVFIAQAVSQKSKHYQFQDKIFQSYDDVIKYVNLDLKEVKNQDEENEMVIYNNQAYGENLDEMFQTINDDYKIETVKTYKNPEDYIVINNNQLSNVVITDVNEKPVRVYKGKNGGAYLDKKDAINTYMQYEKKYLANGARFDSQDATKNAVIKEKDISRQKEEIYKNNASKIEMAKAQLKQSISQDIKLKYERNGIPLDISDSNYKNADFFDLEEQYFKEVNPSKAGYWIEFPTNLKGRFVGSQFIQTYSDIESIFYTNWTKIDSASINLFLLNTVLIGEIVSLFTSLKLNQHQQWDLKQSFFDNDNDLFNEYKKFLKDNGLKSLDALEISHKENINISQQVPMFLKKL